MWNYRFKSPLISMVFLPQILSILKGIWIGSFTFARGIFLLFEILIYFLIIIVGLRMLQKIIFSDP